MRSVSLRITLAVSAICVVAAANAQIFVNGNFESGNLSAWNIANTANGQTTLQNTVQYDIDGAGPRPINWAAKFNVGQVSFNPGVPAGIELTQSLVLTAGLQYYFDFDWSVRRDIATNNSEGGIFSLIVNGNSISTQAAGPTTGTTPIFGHVTGIFTPTLTGTYSVGARIARPFTPGADLNQYVDNFATTVAVPEPATMAVLGLGIAAMIRRRRKS